MLGCQVIGPPPPGPRPSAWKSSECWPDERTELWSPPPGPAQTPEAQASPGLGVGGGKGHQGCQCEKTKGRGWVAGPHGNQDGGHAAKGVRGLPLKLAVARGEIFW
ncbi:hypothetical protein CapIbe_004316 [Capra ibex]